MAKHKWQKHRKIKHHFKSWTERNPCREISLAEPQPGTVFQTEIFGQWVDTAPARENFCEQYVVPSNGNNLILSCNDREYGYYHLGMGNYHQHTYSSPMRINSGDRLAANDVRIAGQGGEWYLENIECSRMNDHTIQVTIYGSRTIDRYNRFETEDLGMVRSETIPRHGQRYSLAQ